MLLDKSQDKRKELLIIMLHHINLSDKILMEESNHSKDEYRQEE